MGVLSFAQRFVSKVRSYKRVFKKENPDVKAVLADLGRLAPVDPTTKLTKPFKDNEVWMYIGRRQIVSHILGKINSKKKEINEGILI